MPEYISMRGAIYLKEYAPAFPCFVPRYAVFLRDRRAWRSRYLRARKARSEDRYPSHCRSGIYICMSDTCVTRQILELRLALVTLRCVSRIHATHCQILRADSTQHPHIMEIDGAKLSNLLSHVKFDYTRRVLAEYYSVTTLKHEKLNHLPDMFTPSWYVTASVKIHDDSNLLEFIHRLPQIDREDTCKLDHYLN